MPAPTKQRTNKNANIEARAYEILEFPASPTETTTQRPLKTTTTTADLHLLVGESPLSTPSSPSSPTYDSDEY
ncbi:14436_t:CDS:2 [Dentiscutata heterogama]|uniref:14436_t:CDS:1 n=1 Tax=Dentiscutata heterogama TaxID=1316150 RepID=A0ACA9PH34_9GLOM|nr:14436_t:CDS:2 [Dentiscutata heterogama]